MTGLDYMNITAGVLHETVTVYPQRARGFTPGFMVGFAMTLMFIFLVLCLVSNVARVSGLSILGCLYLFSLKFVLIGYMYSPNIGNPDNISFWEHLNHRGQAGSLKIDGRMGLLFQYLRRRASFYLVRDSSVVRRHYILLLEPTDVRAQYIRKTADLPHQLWVGTFPRFVAIGFY